MAQMFQYGAYFVIVVLLSVFFPICRFCYYRLGIKIITKFKGNVFSHLLKLPISWFNKQPVGELIARVESDSERVKVLVFGFVYYYNWQCIVFHWWFCNSSFFNGKLRYIFCRQLFFVELATGFCLNI